MIKHKQSALARRAEILIGRKGRQALKTRTKGRTLLTGKMPTPDDFLALALKYNKSQDFLALALKHIQVQADLIRKTKNYPSSAEDKLLTLFWKHPDWTITRLTKKCGIKRQTAYKCKGFIKTKKLFMEQARKDLIDRLPRGYRDKETGWVELHKK